MRFYLAEQNLSIFLKQHILSKYAFFVFPPHTLYGTRRQEVRHFPVSSSNIIHHPFYALVRRRKLIHISTNISVITVQFRN